MPVKVRDLDYLVARLHARRSRLAEGVRLESLRRLAGFPELADAVYPGVEALTVGDFQARLVEDLASELSELSAHLARARARLIEWIAARFRMENLKVAVRGAVSQAAPEEVRLRLLDLPDGGFPGNEKLSAARTLDDLIALLPDGVWRDALNEALLLHHDARSPFFCESALERAYFRELVRRANALESGDREAVRPLVRAETDLFHLALALRGRFFYGLERERLMELHVEGAGISAGRFAALLDAPDPGSALRIALQDMEGAAAVPAEEWETWGWERFRRLARRIFRENPIGLGAVAAYAALRRLEVADLIALSEELRFGPSPDPAQRSGHV